MRKLSIHPTLPHSFKNSNVNPKMETMEGVGVHSLTRNISRVKRHVGTLRWGLGQVTIESIIHTNLHKLNNKLVSVWLDHFWCTDEPWAYAYSQDHHN
jgi:hypothetical protein